MNCALCGSDIAKPGRHCSGCGSDFGKELQEKLSFYFSWKEELRRLNELQNSLFAGIANVSEKIRRYEVVLQRDLERMKASPTRVTKKKAGAKNKRR